MNRTASCIVAAFMLAAGCRDAQKAPLRVGVVAWDADPTGPVELAIREVNSVGGVDGHVVTFESVLTLGDPTVAQQSADKMIADGVIAIVGGFTSGTTLAMANALSAAHVPAISPGATSPLITGAEPPLDYIFRVAPSDVFQARVLGGHAVDVWGCTAVAVIAQNDVYGASLGDELTTVLTARGSPPVAREDIDRTALDYRDALDRIDAANPDCILIAAFVDAGGRVIRQWAESPSRPTVQWGGTDSLHSPMLLSEVLDPALIDGMRGSGVAPFPDTPEYEGFVERFKAIFGREPEGSDARTYDATALILLALGATDATGGEALRAALYEVSRPPGTLIRPGALATGLSILSAGGDIDYVGASGPVDFDENGDVLADYVIWRYVAATNSFVFEEYIRASSILP